MGFVLRLIGNTIYSWFHTALICLLVVGIGYVVTAICTLPLWLCIIVLLFSVGIIEWVRRILVLAMAMPYALISGGRMATIALAVVAQVLNAFWLFHKIWWEMPISSVGVKGILLGIYLTYQTCIVTGLSVFTTFAFSEK